MKGEAVAVELGAAGPAGPAGPVKPLRTYTADLPKCIASCLPVVKTGCCCCTLGTCCFLQGLLALVGCTFMVADLALDISRSELSTTDSQDIAKIVIYLIIIVVISVISILFIYGIVERKPSQLVHFIRLSCVFILLNALYFVIVCAIVGGPIFVYLIFSFILKSGLSVYYLICSHSLYVEMVKELEEEAAGAVQAQPQPSPGPSAPLPPPTKNVVPTAPAPGVDPPPPYPGND